MNFETAHAEPSPKASSPPKLPPARNEPIRVRPVDRQEPPHRSLWWLWLIVFAAVAVGGWFLWSRLSQSSAAAGAGGPAGKNAGAGRPVPVLAEVARRGDMPIYLNGLGTVTPLSTDSIHTRVDGELVKVAYTEGQIVHRDETFDDKKMADLDHGDQDKSDLLVQVDPRPYQVQLEQAQGQLARDEALLANAKLDLTRYVGLYAQKSATDQQVETQKSLVAQYEGTIEIDRSAIHNANLQLYYCNIRTPITGRVGLRLVDVGNIVHATDTNAIAVVTQLQPITVIFTLPEDDIPQVTKNSPDGRGLTVKAVDRDFKMNLGTGVMEAIDNQVDPGSGTLRYRALFKNEDNKLFPGQFVNARLLVDTLKNVVIIPTAAVQQSPTSTFVYVVKHSDVPEKDAGESPDKAKGSDTVEMRKVVVGPTEGTETAIESGVNPGDMLVTDGVDKLTAGAAVKVSAGKPGGAAGKGGKGRETQPSTGPATGADGAGENPAPASAGGHRHGTHSGGGAVPTTGPSTESTQADSPRAGSPQAGPPQPGAGQTPTIDIDNVPGPTGADHVKPTSAKGSE